MKTFEYICEEYLRPFVETMIDFGKFILSCLFMLVVFVSFPIWIIPYSIIKKIIEKKGADNEQRETD